jgi:hypothetical protein
MFSVIRKSAAISRASAQAPASLANATAASLRGRLRPFLPPLAQQGFQGFTQQLGARLVTESRYLIELLFQMVGTSEADSTHGTPQTCCHDVDEMQRCMQSCMTTTSPTLGRSPPRSANGTGWPSV